MLKLLKSKSKQKVNYRDIYCRIFDSLLFKYSENSESRDCLKQLAYYGVKAVNEISKTREGFEYERLLKLFELTELVKTVIAVLTPNELMTVFPVEKRYDGKKYEMKDYFSTMEELQKIGMETVITKQIDYLLWDYMNRDVERFVINSMCILSDIHKFEIGKSIAEIWAEENGIGTYKLCKDETTGKQYLFDSKTGRSTAMKQAIPKHLKVIK